MSAIAMDWAGVKAYLRREYVQRPAICQGAGTGGSRK